MTSVNSGPNSVEPPPGPGGKILALLLLVFVVGVYIATLSGLRLPKSKWSASSSKTWSLADVSAAQAAGDYKRAQRMLLALATKGNHKAQFLLGLDYEEGPGGRTPEIAKAVGWYQKATDGGLVRATARLGHLYLQGVGVTQDFKRARMLLEQAADAGNAAAQFDLARMWEHGWGGEKHLPMAYAWFEYAARQNYEPAVKARDRLLATLKPDQTAEGQKLLQKLKGQVVASAGKALAKQGRPDHALP
jgi:TPR repeat protein